MFSGCSGIFSSDNVGLNDVDLTTNYSFLTVTIANFISLLSLEQQHVQLPFVNYIFADRYFAVHNLFDETVYCSNLHTRSRTERY